MIAADLVADLQLQTRALARRDAKALARATTFARLPELEQQIRRAVAGTITAPAYRLDRMRVWFEPGSGQGAAIAVAALEGTQQLTSYMNRPPKVVRRDAPNPYHQTLELQQGDGRWLVARIRGAAAAKAPAASPSSQQAPAISGRGRGGGLSPLC